MRPKIITHDESGVKVRHDLPRSWWRFLWQELKRLFAKPGE